MPCNARIPQDANGSGSVFSFKFMRRPQEELKLLSAAQKMQQPFSLQPHPRLTAILIVLL